MLSGYLMSLVLNKVYLRQPNGIARFYLNRILRIYPPLILVSSVTAFILLFAPAIKPSTFAIMNNPDTWPGWLSNFTLLNYMSVFGEIKTQVHDMRLIPVAWTLWVEWMFYLLMPFLVRNKRYVLIWVTFSIAYAVFAALSNLSYEMRYNSPLAASLPFSIGCFLYHYMPKISPISWRTINALMLIFAVHAVTRLYSDPMNAGLYVSLGLSTCLVICLTNAKPLSSRMTHIDELCGNLSYSVFLCHYLTGLCIALLLPSLRVQSNDYLYICLPAVFIFSYAVYRCSEYPLIKLRKYIKTTHISPISCN